MKAKKVKPWHEIPPTPRRAGQVYYSSILQDDWLPIPAAILQELGWTEGTEVEILVIEGKQIVVRRKDALRDPEALETSTWTSQ